MFPKFGHRGAPGYPRKGENTIASFNKALAVGANALEFDVRKSKDGQLVVIHDDTVDRTTNGKGKISDLTYEEISKLDAGGGERVPLLEEVLDNFGKRCFLNIELKEPGLAARVKALVLERGLAESVLVSAFDWPELESLRPEISIGLLAEEQIDAAAYVDAAVKLGATAIHPEMPIVTGELVKLAHSRDLKVYTWAVNEPADIARLKALGVDGIFSDCPEVL